MPRLKFALTYAVRHVLLSSAVACLVAAWVFGLIYPAPYRAMLGVGYLFLLILAVDVVCGPILTLILASPKKSVRERWLDFSLIGVVQMAALIYGLHSVWAARPVILAFEVDRLVVATANEVQTQELPQAMPGLQRLPWWGVRAVNTRKPQGGDEFLRSLDEQLHGVSPAMRPEWWLPWETAKPSMAERAKPLSSLLARRPQDAVTLQAAAQRTGLPTESLRYLPLTSSKTLDWVALLNGELNLVGWAPVDGF